jgi:GxxExxY protein
MNRQYTKDVKEGARCEPDAELDRLAKGIVSAALEVHRTLGPGFLEAIYEEALCVELSLRHIPFARQVCVDVEYKGNLLGQARMDLVVDGRLVVELKATECISPVHLAQLLTYLKATRLRLGLVITFNVAVLRTGVRRVVLSP